MKFMDNHCYGTESCSAAPCSSVGTPCVSIQKQFKTTDGGSGAGLPEVVVEFVDLLDLTSGLTGRTSSPRSSNGKQPSIGEQRQLNTRQNESQVKPNTSHVQCPHLQLYIFIYVCVYIYVSVLIHVSTTTRMEDVLNLMLSRQGA